MYFVEDGMLYITAKDSENDSLGLPMHEPSPIMQAAAKAEKKTKNAAEGK
jgi:hypothetical protein